MRTMVKPKRPEASKSGSAAPLVMLPGLLCDSRTFESQLAQFPGSVAINGYGDARRLEEMAENVLAVAPEKMSLLGHSMGARVALEILRIAPQRIDRVALVSTGIHTVRPGEAEKRRALLALGRQKGAGALVEAWLPPMVCDTSLRDVSLMERMKDMCVSAGVATYEAQIAALLNRPPVDQLLGRIDSTVLVAVGALDVWSPPAQHRAIAAAIRGARLRVVENAGHMLPMERPAELNMLISDWLSFGSQDTHDSQHALANPGTE